MSTKFYVDDEGNYLGGFDGTEPPAGAIEVPTAPADARQVWDSETGWGEVPSVDPLTLTLTKRQVNAALILAGHTDPDAFIEAAIATVEDETARALALNDWRLAPYYKRDHPLLNNADILAAAGFTSQDVDALWAVAVTLDR